MDQGDIDVDWGGYTLEDDEWEDYAPQTETVMEETLEGEWDRAIGNEHGTKNVGEKPQKKKVVSTYPIGLKITLMI